MTNESTVLSLSRADRVLITIGPAAVGLVLALVLPTIARWLLGLGIPLPFGFVFKAAAGVDTGWNLAVQAAILVALGLLATVAVLSRVTRVTVTGDRVELHTGGETRTLTRDQVGALYLEKDTLIVLDRESRQVFHGEPGASRARIKEAFGKHGYPWRDEDPFAGLYQSWTPQAGGLPVEVDAVLSARAVALRKKAGREAGELRETLEKLGYAVRDEGDKQFWRPLVRS